jgi:hypothetical protein
VALVFAVAVATRTNYMSARPSTFGGWKNVKLPNCCGYEQK